MKSYRGRRHAENENAAQSPMKFLKQNDPELPIVLYTGMEHDGEAIMALLQEGAHFVYPACQ